MDSDSSTPSLGPDGAIRRACANHPELTAVLTCSRCGDYACSVCAGPQSLEKPLCKRCGGSDSEARRKELGPHERQVRGIALYYWLAAVGLGVVGVAAVYSGIAQAPDADADSGIVAVIVALLFVSPFVALFGTAAWQLQRFTKLGQVLGAISAVPGLCSVPVGTLISGFTLWALLGKKGQAVFTPEYREAIAATPHLHYGVSLVSKIALGLLVIVLVFAAGALLWDG